MTQLQTVRSALARHLPVSLDAPSRAAVAMLLRPGRAARPEVLLIERAHKEGDPWSGHMAFPGGRTSPYDASLRATAERETLEEVGLDLVGAELLGQLDDLEGRNAGRPVGLAISAFVYALAEAPPLAVPNAEVQSALWVPLDLLAEPARHVEYRFASERGRLAMPGIRVGEAEPHVVWGLTYRFLEDFFALIGDPLPNRWGGVIETLR